MAVPAAPVQAPAESAPSGTMVSWSASVGATGYKVQRRIGAAPFVTVYTTPATSKLDDHAADGVTFEYRIIAYNADGDSEPSNTDTETGEVVTDGFDPSLTSATVNSAGDTLTLAFSEWVSGVFVSEYALSGGHTLSDAAGPSGATWTMTVSPRVELGETLTLDYTGTSTMDADGAVMDQVADLAVTNDSTQTGTESPTTYGTRAGIEGIYGTQNVRDYADVNDNSDAADISAQIDRARQHAYDWINSKIRGADLTAPATDVIFSEFGLLDDIENERAGAWLYFKRGKNDNDPTGPAQMQWHWDNAEKELDRIIGIVVGEDEDTAGAGEFQFIPIRRTTPTDENSE